MLGQDVTKAFDKQIIPFPKYLNYCTNNTGFQVTLANGSASAVSALSMTTAIDVHGRDPKDWEIYGSNDGGNSSLLIAQAQGNFAVNEEGLVTQIIWFTNTERYNVYKVIFPNVVNTNCTDCYPYYPNNGIGDPCDSMQVAEVDLGN